ETHMDEAEIADGVARRVEIRIAIAEPPRKVRRGVRPWLAAVVNEYPATRCVHPLRPRPAALPPRARLLSESGYQELTVLGPAPLPLPMLFASLSIQSRASSVPMPR